jgi:hypothetical protein
MNKTDNGTLDLFAEDITTEPLDLAQSLSTTGCFSTVSTASCPGSVATGGCISSA